MDEHGAALGGQRRQIGRVREGAAE
uniref:Uncharacterized protein n=1 Tax=Arundo donax TaxID=35708 RepID=A0A0A9CZF1_ARUDO